MAAETLAAPNPISPRDIADVAHLALTNLSAREPSKELREIFNQKRWSSLFDDGGQARSWWDSFRENHHLKAGDLEDEEPLDEEFSKTVAQALKDENPSFTLLHINDLLRIADTGLYNSPIKIPSVVHCNMLQMVFEAVIARELGYFPKVDPAVMAKNEFIQYAAYHLQERHGDRVASLRDLYDEQRHVAQSPKLVAKDEKPRGIDYVRKLKESVALTSAERQAKKLWDRLGVRIPDGAKYHYDMRKDDTVDAITAQVDDRHGAYRLFRWQRGKDKNNDAVTITRRIQLAEGKTYDASLVVTDWKLDRNAATVEVSGPEQVDFAFDVWDGKLIRVRGLVGFYAPSQLDQAREVTGLWLEDWGEVYKAFGPHVDISATAREWAEQEVGSKEFRGEFKPYAEVILDPEIRERMENR